MKIFTFFITIILLSTNFNQVISKEVREKQYPQSRQLRRGFRGRSSGKGGGSSESRSIYYKKFETYNGAFYNGKSYI
jgi:hypothetical protein